MVVFTGTLDSVSSEYVKADGVNLSVSTGRITFSLSSLMIDGNLIDAGASNVVLKVGGSSTGFSLSPSGQLSATTDIPVARYADGDVLIAYQDSSSASGYAEGSISLGPIDVTPPMTGTVIPVPLADGSYLLKISDVTYDGDPLTAQAEIQDQNKKESPILVDFSASPPSLNVYGPYSLTDNSVYFLTYSNSRLQFIAGDYVSGSLSVSNVTATGATITLTPSAGEALFSANNREVSSFTDGPSKYKLYNSTGLVDTQTYNGTDCIFTQTGLSSNVVYTYGVRYADTLTVDRTTYDILSHSFLSTGFATSGGGQTTGPTGPSGPPHGGNGATGGTGSTGSTGNTGGNDYNNMPASLTFNPAYTVDASYSESVTVYGETAVTRTDYPDTLAVSVPVADLEGILSFMKSGESAASDFGVSLAGISAAVKTALEARLGTDHPLPSLSSMGIDARSILSHTAGSWSADVTALDQTDSSDAARNVYEQAADKGKLSSTDGKLALSAGDQFVFYMDTSATQSLAITIDDVTLSGAAKSDVAPLIPFAGVFGASNSAGDKGTISKSWAYKFTVTVTAA